LLPICEDQEIALRVIDTIAVERKKLLCWNPSMVVVVIRSGEIGGKVIVGVARDYSGRC
jgi:hypothetical protein